MASSSSSDWEFDVFLSFRGTDTRNTFTGHLNTALKSKGIRTFIDDKELRRGEDISSTLFTTIEKSRCSTVVLSECYATSKWCLEELVKMLECKTTIKQRVVPIFYHVDPSDVRGQGGSFGQALDAHKKNLKIEEKQLQRWSAALTEVGNLSGWDLGNKSEAQLILDIVADISKYLNCASSNNAQNLVGVDSCIKESESVLCFESTDVRMIGICGMSGIGKTALARSIYERFSDKFEGCCFLTNVGNVEREGTDYWKKDLLSSVLKDNDIDVTITSIKTRLGSKKVLIVVDNVSHQLTMKTLIGKHDWFGPQSRIIITTRNKRFLSGMDAMYEVQKLQDDKVVELFNHCAFRKDHPAESFERFSLRFIAYAQGLPLALEVLGSSLYKKDQDYWKSKLDELEKTLDKEIQGVLQKSFDELNDNEKDIFLDIACFFKCSNKDHIMKILESCNLFPGSGIENLIDRFLITFSCEKLEMHDLLQKMGWKIVTQTSKEPGKRGRLWMQDHICHVLEKNTGTKEVKGIFLNLFGLKEIHFTTEAFARMNRLRLLKVYESNLSDDSDSESTSRKRKCKMRFSDDFEFHSDELRYLYWHEYPLQTLPSHFKPKNLVCLCMPYSQITELWKGSQVCENLKFLDLSNSKFLMETPDFSRITNLEALVLDGCTNLCHLHSSLGRLRKLAFLSVSNCIKLRDFPAIYELVSVQTLDLSGCSNLQKFPDISQHMPCLSKLYLDGTAITEIPASIAYASELVLLDLTNCKELKFLPSSIAKLTLLRILTLSGCSKLGKFQQNSGNLDRLVELKADGSTIRQPPSSRAVLRNHKASA
ncbi:disease resistance protein RUN1-like [Vitis riparia]|uniref:disease resistance protein RUN1-like n=1 Tax=Vitis riparia TaxID=96939 RepID=UPI00155B2427|nr:disease resistance protein RUN1-like [Vitis riparia]XP_034675065.1 disease resistance protein RUN1-like [Vitis riparia]